MSSYTAALSASRKKRKARQNGGQHLFTGISSDSICEQVRKAKGDEEKIIAVNSIEKANKFYFFFVVELEGTRVKKKFVSFGPGGVQSY